MWYTRCKHLWPIRAVVITLRLLSWLCLLAFHISIMLFSYFNFFIKKLNRLEPILTEMLFRRFSTLCKIPVSLKNLMWLLGPIICYSLDKIQNILFFEISIELLLVRYVPLWPSTSIIVYVFFFFNLNPRWPPLVQDKNVNMRHCVQIYMYKKLFSITCKSD